MRITGGRWRGRIVACPPGVIRPMMDRMRESMFSILGDISGLSFLDLFAGSGIMSLEALSRGAAGAMLVENDVKKRSVILENLKIAGNDYSREELILLIRPAERVLKPGMKRFDLVHLDPPFALTNKMRLLELAQLAGQPAPEGVLAIHHPAGEQLPGELGALRCPDRRIYGQSSLTFYTRSD
ncbi:MAG: 16S rRNA (guanine(966)-N(2))-methyltransferase RsmD [Spirochaeta sp. LUC14_002_19_P3]|nr:MAG: 16S rRNA (guanine(966)-N(2))-methyltransferase RsmD [Spirochaeta sp. LUC14_002_19_P3]